MGTSSVPRLVAALVLACPIALAQYPDHDPRVLGLDLRIDSDGGSNGDPPGASSSQFPRVVGTSGGVTGDEVHVVWQDYRERGANGPALKDTSSIYYRRIRNYGAGVQPTEIWISEVGLEGQHDQLHSTRPKLATDGDQTLYVVWHAFGTSNAQPALQNVGEKILFARSQDNGDTWDAPLVLNTLAAYAGAPEITVDDAGRVYVAWAQLDPTPGSPGVDQIRFTASDDQGTTWIGPLMVNDDVTAHSDTPRLAADASGNVYVGYHNHRNIACCPTGEITERYRDVFVQHTTSDALFPTPVPTPFGPAEQLNSSGLTCDLQLAAYSSGEPIPAEQFVIATWIDLSGKDDNRTQVMSNLSQHGAGFLEQELPVSDIDPQPMPRGGAGPGPAAVGPSGTTAPGGTLSTGPSLTGTGTDQDLAGQPGPAAQSLAMALGPDGEVWVAYGWIPQPIAFQPTLIVVNRFDGAGWSPSRTVGAPSAPFFSKGDMLLPRPRLFVAEEERVYVTWMHSSTVTQGAQIENAYETYADINVAWSGPGGETWSGPAGVTTKPFGAGSSRSAFPDLFARGNQAVLVWDDRRGHSLPPGPLPPGAPAGAPDVYLNTLIVP